MNAAALARCCRRAHFQLAEDLAPFAVVCWTLHWRIAAGEAFVQKVPPDPCVQIVVEELEAITGAAGTVGRTAAPRDLETVRLPPQPRSLEIGGEGDAAHA